MQIKVVCGPPLISFRLPLAVALCLFERGLSGITLSLSLSLSLRHHYCYNKVGLLYNTRTHSEKQALMENLFGLLKVRVKRGINLAVRDVRSSDPYVVIKMGRQRLKTSVMYNNVNPEWNEDLTLSVTDPNLPVKLTVYDKDTFSLDDKMGVAEFNIKPFIEAVKMHLEDLPSGTIVTRVTPSRENYLSEESSVVWENGQIKQDICLRLRNVECGEVELQLHWVDIPGSRGI